MQQDNRKDNNPARRGFLKAATATGLASPGASAFAQSFGFGGPKNNRLYRASRHSLYALYVESHGAI